MVDDDDFREGFVQGFRAVRGRTAMMPMIPMRPSTKMGRTPFQMGIMRGIEKGKGWSGGELLNKN